LARKFKNCKASLELGSQMVSSYDWENGRGRTGLLINQSIKNFNDLLGMKQVDSNTNCESKKIKERR